VNKSLANKEETAYRKAKERKAWEKHKRVTGYLKSTANQKDNTETGCRIPYCSP
jgi:hypothetical protein